MRNVWLICRRELGAFFFSPIAYVILVAWAGIMGFFYSQAFLNYAVASMQLMRNPQLAARYAEAGVTPTTFVLNGGVFGIIALILLFVSPLLTMRLFSEEKKEGTIELLLTYPMRDWEMLMGKYLSALLMYLIMLALTFVYPVLLSAFVEVEWSVVGAAYLGMFLMGSAFLSIGLLASSLTSNQIIAAIASFVILLLSFVMGIGAISQLMGPTVGAVMRHMSIGVHLASFTRGIIDTRDVVYLINVNILCLFLSMRSLEYYKWRG
jgi:ABC-2 type transport system permease protein